MFLGGAYQEVMGNLHNLFGSTDAAHIRLAPGGDYQVDHVVRGDTNADVLEMMRKETWLDAEAAVAAGFADKADAPAVAAPKPVEAVWEFIAGNANERVQ